MAIKKLRNKHCLSRIAVDHGNMMNIDKVFKVPSIFSEEDGNGTLHIRCESDIIIDVEGGIVADAAGLRSAADWKDYKEYKQLRKAAAKRHTKLLVTLNEHQSEQANTLQASATVGAGGGMVALRSFSNIVNNGVLSCNGSAGGEHGGGSIHLCADGFIMNHGKIECKPHGQIMVRCRQFVNEGVVSPEPQVIIIDETERKEIVMVMMPWSRSGGKLQNIPLTVYQHRKHLVSKEDKNRYHPRNLLDKKGIETEYQGQYPPDGDWITFKFEGPFIVIPKAVVIRNCDAHWGLKSISLSLSVDGDEFDDFAVIQHIDNDNQDEQYLNLKDVMLSNAKLWTKEYKYLKLKVIDAWNFAWVRFHSFSVFGIECVSN